MKILANTILLAGALSICGADETDGWEVFREHLKIGNPELETLPALSESGFEADSFFVRIKNESDSPMSYEGYFTDEPQYFTSELVDGAWIARPNLWCGTGMKWHELKPGEEATLNFQRNLKKRQIFVIFYASEGRSSLVKVWDPTTDSGTDVER